VIAELIESSEAGENGKKVTINYTKDELAKYDHLSKMSQLYAKYNQVSVVNVGPNGIAQISKVELENSSSVLNPNYSVGDVSQQQIQPFLGDYQQQASENLVVEPMLSLNQVVRQTSEPNELLNANGIKQQPQNSMPVHHNIASINHQSLHHHTHHNHHSHHVQQNGQITQSQLNAIQHQQSLQQTLDLIDQNNKLQQQYEQLYNSIPINNNGASNNSPAASQQTNLSLVTNGTNGTNGGDVSSVPVSVNGAGNGLVENAVALKQNELEGLSVPQDITLVGADNGSAQQAQNVWVLIKLKQNIFLHLREIKMAKSLSY
jgi:hypothetical protein